MIAHKQVIARVNTHLDCGVAGVVRALSEFPELQTTESCEGPPDAPAWVAFLYGSHWADPWRPLAEFVLGYFGPGLARSVGNSARVSIRVTESSHIIGEMVVEKERMADVESAIRSLAKEFSERQHRRCECCDGTSGTLR